MSWLRFGTTSSRLMAELLASFMTIYLSTARFSFSAEPGSFVDRRDAHFARTDLRLRFKTKTRLPSIHNDLFSRTAFQGCHTPPCFPLMATDEFGTSRWRMAASCDSASPAGFVAPAGGRDRGKGPDSSTPDRATAGGPTAAYGGNKSRSYPSSQFIPG